VRPIKPYLRLARGACWAALLVLVVHEVRKANRTAVAATKGAAPESVKSKEAISHPSLLAEE
jgi:hypothetical protein